MCFIVQDQAAAADKLLKKSSHIENNTFLANAHLQGVM